MAGPQCANEQRVGLGLGEKRGLRGDCGGRREAGPAAWRQRPSLYGWTGGGAGAPATPVPYAGLSLGAGWGGTTAANRLTFERGRGSL
jgi:hypothetical protein